MPGTNLRKFPNTREEPPALYKPAKDPLPGWFSPTVQLVVVVPSTVPGILEWYFDDLATAEQLANGHVKYTGPTTTDDSFASAELWYDDATPGSLIQCFGVYQTPVDIAGGQKLITFGPIAADFNNRSHLSREFTIQFDDFPNEIVPACWPFGQLTVPQWELRAVDPLEPEVTPQILHNVSCD